LQVNIHWLNTFNFSAICGQSNTLTLSLHHLANVSTAVSLFSSRPDQLTLKPDKLTLPRTTQTQLHFRPFAVGNVDTLLNIVERSTGRIVDTVLVQMHTRTPQVTRVFEVDLPVGTVVHKKVRIHIVSPGGRLIVQAAGQDCWMCSPYESFDSTFFL
jgi:nephrocystin-4